MDNVLILDLAEIRANDVRNKLNRIIELNRMIHCCEVTRRSLLDIKDPERMSMTAMMSQFQNKWQKELERLEQKA